MATIGRSNTPLQVGQIVNGAWQGTGRAATLLAAPSAGLFVDIVMLVISGTAADSAVLSDGSNSFTFKIAASSPLVLALNIPLKITTSATG